MQRSHERPRIARLSVPAAALCAASILSAPDALAAQSEYRNVDGGRPVRVEDASATPLHGMDVQIASARVERISAGTYRLVLEPRLAYGVLPRTELKLRAPFAFRERGVTPRQGLVGVGAGLFHNLNLESANLPAVALEGEVAASAGGATASGATYSGRAIATRSFEKVRVHVNAGMGNYRVRVAGFGVPAGPPIPDAPCSVGAQRQSANDVPGREGQRFSRSRSAAATCASSGALLPLVVDTGGTRFFGGVALDKTLPLRSLLLIADVFVDRSRGPAGSTDWITEVGARRQLTPRTVVDVMLGRRMTRSASLWVMSIGATTSVSARMLIPEAQ